MAATKETGMAVAMAKVIAKAMAKAVAKAMDMASGHGPLAMAHGRSHGP